MAQIMPRVLFVQRMIPDYRLPFFVRLHKLLKESGIDFYVTTGKSLPEDCLNDSIADYPWIITHKNYYLYKKIHIHNISRIKSYDLVIVMQENSHLINYWLLFRRVLVGQPLIAFYGHGKNLNVKNNGIREYIKKLISLLPDWWFAYTALTERVIKENGYSQERITVVNNAIDVASIKRYCADGGGDSQLSLRKEVGIKENSKVALYCGRLIDIKVSFLIESLKAVHRENDAFEVIIIGKGPLEEIMRSYSEKYHWFHYVGAVYGDERNKYFYVADMFLMPGLVGLAILDAFAAGIPIITADCKVHSPEIEYLEQGINGFMTSNTVDKYVELVSELIQDNDKLNALKKHARQSADKYSIDNMSASFLAGIQQVLVSSKKR